MRPHANIIMFHNNFHCKFSEGSVILLDNDKLSIPDTVASQGKIAL